MSLVSAICVTNGNEFYLKRAIICFLNQTYLKKELIIVHEKKCPFFFNLKKEYIDHNNIKFYHIERDLQYSLGKLRNFAISQSNGKYICQWDDDDWYHPERIKIQLESLIKSKLPSTILTKWTVFDSIKNEAYISNERLWEGSILCLKSIFKKISYSDEEKGEDTPVISYLDNRNEIFRIKNMPYLYIYVFHGENTWSIDHWEKIFSASIKLSDNESKIIREILKKL